MDKKHFEKISYDIVGGVVYVKAKGQGGFGKFSIRISNNVLYVYNRGKLILVTSTFVLTIE